LIDVMPTRNPSAQEALRAGLTSPAGLGEGKMKGGCILGISGNLGQYMTSHGLERITVNLNQIDRDPPWPEGAQVLPQRQLDNHTAQDSPLLNLQFRKADAVVGEYRRGREIGHVVLLWLGKDCCHPETKSLGQN